jgi:predicted nucleic-acid-binding Zn-ribbon protein
MKRTKQCPKCHDRRIGHLESQPDLDWSLPGNADERLDEKLRYAKTVSPRPIAVGSETVDTGMWKWNELLPLHGFLEAYVCTACGYYESYVKQPETVPWTKLEGFAWVNEAETGPYR